MRKVLPGGLASGAVLPGAFVRLEVVFHFSALLSSSPNASIIYLPSQASARSQCERLL